MSDNADCYPCEYCECRHQTLSASSLLGWLFYCQQPREQSRPKPPQDGDTTGRRMELPDNTQNLNRTSNNPASISDCGDHERERNLPARKTTTQSKDGDANEGRCGEGVLALSDLNAPRLLVWALVVEGLWYWGHSPGDICIELVALGLGYALVRHRFSLNARAASMMALYTITIVTLVCLVAITSHRVYKDVELIAKKLIIREYSRSVSWTPHMYATVLSITAMTLIIRKHCSSHDK